MKRLIFSPPFLPLPNATDVLRQVPWLREADDATLAFILGQSFELHVKKDQLLLRQVRIRMQAGASCSRSCPRVG